MRGNSTKLVGKHVSIDNVCRELGKGDGETVALIFWPGRSAWKPYIRVPEGMYALVQTFGADINHPATGDAVWPAGFHWANPMTKIHALVTKQNVVFEIPIKGVKTKDDVSVEINVALILRIMGDKEKGEDPNLVRTFVYNLGPGGLENQLKDAQEEAVRALARSVEHTQVYALRSANYDVTEGTGARITTAAAEDVDVSAGMVGGQEVTANMKRALNDQFQRFGVEIIDVAITDVRLPPMFTRQMQEKTTYITVIAEQRMKQRFDMQAVRYNEEVETTRQANREEQDKLKAEGEKLVAEVQKELSLLEAETRKMTAELEQTQRSEVLQIKSQGELEVAKVVARKDNLLAQIRAEAQATSEALLADKDAYRVTKKSEATMKVAQNDARASEILGEAEGLAAPKVKARRVVELQKQQLQVYRALSENKTVTLSGTASNSLLPDMLVAQRQSQVLLNVNTGAGGAGLTGAQSSRGLLS